MISSPKKNKKKVTGQVIPTRRMCRRFLWLSLQPVRLESNGKLTTTGLSARPSLLYLSLPSLYHHNHYLSAAVRGGLSLCRQR